TDGQLSIIPKPEKRPVVTEDLGITPEYEGLPLSIIMDGRILRNDLKKLDITEEWLLDQLKSAGYDDVSEVLFASLEDGGRLFVQGKQKKVMK
ncbi:MAG TPA: YetF domain-containing protein, partial [Clostridia bacterium]|nr:YetF domain-containing protein [Clostridia bacterium]